MCTILTYQVKLIHSSVERVAMGRCVSHDADDDDEMTSSEIDEKQDENATLTMCSFSSFYTASHICCVAAIYFHASSSSMQVVRHECLIKPTEISSMQLLYVNKTACWKHQKVFYEFSNRTSMTLVKTLQKFVLLIDFPSCDDDVDKIFNGNYSNTHVELTE